MLGRRRHTCDRERESAGVGLAYGTLPALIMAASRSERSDLSRVPARSEPSAPTAPIVHDMLELARAGDVGS